MANRIYCATGTTGGATGALDSIDGDDLADKDMAIVMDQTNVRFYVLDDDASGEEDTSNYTIINPDENAGTKSWILQSISVNDISYVQDDLVVTDDATIGGDVEIKGATQFGDADGTGGDVTFYSDTTGDHIVFDASAKTITITDVEFIANNVDIAGGEIDGVTIGTNSAVTELVVDNININGSTITGVSDANTVITAYAGKAIAVESVTFDGGAMGGITNIALTGYIEFDGTGAQVAAWSGADLVGITGTAGTGGNPPVWNSDGDLVEGPVATAANDFIVATAANTWAKKTLAETGAILEADIDHGSIQGLTDDDHTQYILHSLADAENDFLIASADNTFVKKTLAEAGAILEADIDHGNLQGLDTGADHSYIDQDVTTSGTPSFTSVAVDGLELTADTITNDAALSITAPGITLQSDETALVFTDDGSVAIHHDSGKVFETITAGINIGDGTDVCPITYANAGDILTFTCTTVDIDGASTATTYDADTDFTVGSTVITDGVITDATGIQLDGNVDITGTLSIGGKLTAGANEVEGSSFDINGGTIDGVTLFDQVTDFTGADTDGVSGTAGTAQHLGMWNADGDLVEPSGEVLLADALTIKMDSAPSSDETGTGLCIDGTVDANTYGIAGLLVLSSDGNWDDADADAEATVGQLALAMEAGTGTKRLLLNGIMRDDTFDFTIGAQLYVSTTVGQITETAPSGDGDFVQVVGYAITADIIMFNPSPDYMEITA